jgi:hypothetical protein
MSDSLEQARVHRAGLRAAIGRVERALSMPAPGRADVWAKELREELHGLSDALEQHIAITESDNGLLADIIEAAPRLAHRVDVTRNDHVHLRDRLHTALESLTESPEGVADARDRVVELLTALVRHRHLGADLVYEAYNVDIEAMD